MSTTMADRLSKRAMQLKPSATLEVSARVRALRAEGLDIVGFGVGEPDFDTPENICDAAVAALRDGQTRYAPVAGLPTARAAIAAKLRNDNGIVCDAEHVVISTGAKHSIYLALQAIVDPGREVVVPTPAWVSYRPMVELAGGTAVEVPGSIESDYKITPAQLEAAITPRTAAMLLNSPSNPCGTMYDQSELRALAEVLERHDHVIVISDEIYEKLVFGGIEHFSLGSIPTLAERVITINGLSKAYAMTGWRVGYAAAPGFDGLFARTLTKLQGQMTSNITTFCYAAIVEALAGGAADVERMRSSFAERGALMHEMLLAMEGVRCPKPTGAFYVFPDVSAAFGKRSPDGVTIDGSKCFAERLLEEAHVAVVSGGDFGASGEGHVRLGFAASTETIREGCARLARWLGSLV